MRTHFTVCNITAIVSDRAVSLSLVSLMMPYSVGLNRFSYTSTTDHYTYIQSIKTDLHQSRQSPQSKCIRAKRYHVKSRLADHFDLVFTLLTILSQHNRLLQKFVLALRRFMIDKFRVYGLRAVCNQIQHGTEQRSTYGFLCVVFVFVVVCLQHGLVAVWQWCRVFYF